jgi:hypothetical protein
MHLFSLVFFFFCFKGFFFGLLIYLLLQGYVVERYNLCEHCYVHSQIQHLCVLEVGANYFVKLGFVKHRKGGEGV